MSYDTMDNAWLLCWDFTDDDTTPPLYTAQEESAIDRLQRLAGELDGDGHGLPIVGYPNGGQIYDEDNNVLAPYKRRQVMVKQYFNAIRLENSDLVILLVGSGIVTSETTDNRERTPLLLAVAARSTKMVQQLIDLGADVNAFSVRPVLPPPNYGPWLATRNCTPLQVAAEQGNMVMMKFLVEKHQADSSIIAPDGQHALRLAAINGYKEIIEYLLAHRGGEWLRWKSQHSDHFLRIGKAFSDIYFFFQIPFWYAPRVILGNLPQYLIRGPIADRATWLKGHYEELLEIFIRWANKLPKKLWKLLKNVPVWMGRSWIAFATL